MEKEKKLIRTKKGPREYSYLGCPLTRNRTAWCFRLCTPDAEGHGRCGRIAPHSLKSAIQTAIESHNKKQIEQRLKNMEQAYLANPDYQVRDPGIRISEGEADIVLPLRDEDKHPSGGVLDAVCFKLMNASGDLIARGRYVGRAGSNYLADAILTDSEGRELGRGEGVFFEGTKNISSPDTDPTTPDGD